MRSMVLAGAKAWAPPSSPAELCIVALHPNDKKIALTMTEEDGGRTSVMMVVVDADGGRGGCRPNRCHWRLEVILPSPTFPPSCNDGDLRGA